jgi:hypothetical protein
LVPFALLVAYVVCAILFANPLGHEVFWFVIAYALAGTPVPTRRMENSPSR